MKNLIAYPDPAVFLNGAAGLLQLARDNSHAYRSNSPFPHIVFRDFFDPVLLKEVLKEFPDLSTVEDAYKFDNHNEKKLAARGESRFGPATKCLMHYLNSEPVLNFLQELTGIEEPLIPDPYFIGGGYHEIKPGGLLKVHADFNKNRLTKLDRRINLLVYLNQDWEESYGGHFELWNKEMTHAEKRILPDFNTVAIFSTTDFSYHGHPNPLTCPPDRSRKSLALYYYTNGRPESEIDRRQEEHSTLFVGRKGVKTDVRHQTFKFSDLVTLGKNWLPPVIYNRLKRLK
ncbi:2OG-Fe(II) oxygenase [Pedobacter deserti]|uniref:2OG-Fe(II) oxygenase n=1 Tax=Pedobacter deserti TaxID=2817382 RepID=UPI00210D454C|nr:2OG-Fe(II) oxygenase [Pedobacter sp. SYSU D00382]